MESIIVITSNGNKKNILSSLSKKKFLYNLKFYTFEELKKKVFFDYDAKTLEYIMENYQVKLDIARMYIENMYYLKDLEIPKIKFLNNLKKELIAHDLLIFSDDFKKYIKNKKVVIYNYQISLEEQLILDNLGVNYEIVDNTLEEYEPLVFEAKNIEDECEFVTNKISELLYNDIKIEKIKIIMPDEYLNIMKRYLDIFNIPYNFKNNNSFFSTMIAQDFLKNYKNLELEDNILLLKEKYENINDLIKIINKTALVRNLEIRKEFIIEELKKAQVNTKIYSNAIDRGNIEDYYKDDEYVFLLGFNIGNFPKVYRDDEYLADEVKTLLGIDTSIDKNMVEKAKISKQINRIKNLIITYKLSDKKGKREPSILIKDLNLEVKQVEFDRNICYSRKFSEIKYAMMLDNLNKYNMISDDLYLYQKNLDIRYLEYNEQFKGVNKKLLKDSFKDGLKLAYTNLEMYNECAFKYYISKVLKLDIYEESFKTIIGTITHHILELIYTKDVNIPEEIMAFVKEQEYEIGSREYFYLDILSEELDKIRKVLKEQAKRTKLNNYLFEEELYVYKDRDINITFKGLIDKVMEGEFNGKKVIAVVDYKTGNALITLDNLKYGLNIQLPIYLYLLKNSLRFKEAIIGGFYIQKVLEPVPNISDKTIEEVRKDNLRLHGFSNSDEDILALIDEEFQEDSIIKDLKYKKDGTLSARAKVLSNEEMENIQAQVDVIIDKCIDNILEGNFEVNPKVIKGKNIACTYCHFKDICFRKKSDEVVLGGEDDASDEGTTISN